MDALDAFDGIADDIWDERERQNEKWGDQHHPDGTGDQYAVGLAEENRNVCQTNAANGNVTWMDILLEEVWEALAEDDLGKLRAELIQVAAVCCAWVEDIDGRD